MTQAISQVETNLKVDIGSSLQCDLNATSIGLATSIPLSSNVISYYIFTNGYKLFTFGITSTQAGTVTIQRYIDMTGNIKQGSAITGSLSASTPLVVSLSDTLPFQMMTIEVSNSSDSTAATLSNVLLLLQSF